MLALPIKPRQLSLSKRSSLHVILLSLRRRFDLCVMLMSLLQNFYLQNISARRNSPTFFKVLRMNEVAPSIMDMNPNLPASNTDSWGSSLSFMTKGWSSPSTRSSSMMPSGWNICTKEWITQYCTVWCFMKRQLVYCKGTCVPVR